MCQIVSMNKLNFKLKNMLNLFQHLDNNLCMDERIKDMKVENWMIKFALLSWVKEMSTWAKVIWRWQRKICKNNVSTYFHHLSVSKKIFPLKLLFLTHLHHITDREQNTAMASSSPMPPVRMGYLLGGFTLVILFWLYWGIMVCGGSGTRLFFIRSTWATHVAWLGRQDDIPSGLFSFPVHSSSNNSNQVSSSSLSFSRLLTSFVQQTWSWFQDLLNSFSQCSLSFFVIKYLFLLVLAC